MKEIAPKLWVGSQADFVKLNELGTEWPIVHAAKEPWHREAVGYTTRAAPKDHAEYLYAVRGNRLILNLIDAADPKYVSKPLIDKAVSFIGEQLKLLSPDAPTALLIACNQGGSRAPTLGMLYLAPTLPADFEAAEAEYRKLCPSYAPANGMREFARIYWSVYHARAGIPAANTLEDGYVQDTATSCPARAATADTDHPAHGSAGHHPEVAGRVERLSGPAGRNGGSGDDHDAAGAHRAVGMHLAARAAAPATAAGAEGQPEPGAT